MKYPNLYALFRERVGRYTGDVFYVREGGGWRGISWERFGRDAHAVASALLASGLGRGAAVCVLMGNVPEWPVCDLGVIAAGGVSCGLYPTSSADANACASRPKRSHETARHAPPSRTWKASRPAYSATRSRKSA